MKYVKILNMENHSYNGVLLWTSKRKKFYCAFKTEDDHLPRTTSIQSV